MTRNRTNWIGSLLILAVLAAWFFPSRELHAQVQLPPEGGEQEAPATTKISDGEWPPPRDPFWPVGWMPPKPGKKEVKEAPKKVEKKEDPPKWSDASKQLNVKGVMKSPTGDYVAMINNKVVKEGEFITVPFRGKTYKWKVRSINKRGVKFEPIEVK